MRKKTNKRILVLETDKLLSGGVSSLLKNRQDLDVIGLCLTGDEDLEEIIAGIKPDVIIFPEGYNAADLDAMIYRSNDLPRLRTITVNLRNNRILICDKRQVAIRKLNDFLSVL